MNTLYNVEEWAAENTRGRQVFNYNYRMLGTDVKGWKLAKVVTIQETPEATERVYLWQSKTDPGREMIRVGITERHSWLLAQESLHEHLIHCTRPGIPRGAKNLEQLGDINFVGREPGTDLTAAISFIRGNVCVSVSSVGERSVDVSSIATAVDQALRSPPAKRELEKGRVQVQGPKVAKVKAEEAYALIESLQEAAPAGEWLKIIVPDGELSRKGDALLYVSSQGGEKQVNAFRVHGK